MTCRKPIRQCIVLGILMFHDADQVGFRPINDDGMDGPVFIINCDSSSCNDRYDARFKSRKIRAPRTVGWFRVVLRSGSLVGNISLLRVGGWWKKVGSGAVTLTASPIGTLYRQA